MSVVIYLVQLLFEGEWYSIGEHGWSPGDSHAPTEFASSADAFKEHDRRLSINPSNSYRVVRAERVTTNKVTDVVTREANTTYSYDYKPVKEA